MRSWKNIYLSTILSLIVVFVYINSCIIHNHYRSNVMFNSLKMFETENSGRQLMCLKNNMIIRMYD